jgi:hypothetical protein
MLGALLVTALVGAALLASVRERAEPRVHREPLTVVLLPLALPAPREAVPVPRVDPRRDESARDRPSAARDRRVGAARTPRVRDVRDTRGREAPSIDFVPAPVSAPQPDAAMTAPPPAAAASAPALNLGRDVIDTAVRRARSPVRSMAESSGAYTGTGPQSTSETVAAGIARSAKPDCIGPNAQGSLLSIFTIARDVLTDRCR